MVTFMRESCHLKRTSNVKVGVVTKIAEQFFLLFHEAKHKKVKKKIKIRSQFEHSTASPNDMIHAIV